MAASISKQGCPVSAKECRRKWHGLCRTYKKITAHNKTSGSERHTWPYYRQMHDILGDDPVVEPAVYTASNEQIDKVTPMAHYKEQMPQSDPSESRRFRQSSLHSLSQRETRPTRPIKRKKDVLCETEKERRHHDKMQRLDTFSSLLQRLDESLCETDKERYHQEKMQRVDTFNSLLERLVRCVEQKHHST